MQLCKLLDGGDVSQFDKVKLFKSIRAFYVEAMTYALENLPLRDNLLRNAKFLNFEAKDTANISQVGYFVRLV